MRITGDKRTLWRYAPHSLTPAPHWRGYGLLHRSAMSFADKGATPVAFVQIIEFQTQRIDDFVRQVDEWLEASADWRTATRGTLCADKDKPGTYMQIVEFPSYEDAMANSNDPRTAEFASRLGALCDGPPSFRNLDVVSVEEM
jgi:quinol monooxygenase YgiN